jgi:hypothetical protein
MRSVGDDRVVGQTLTNLALVQVATGRVDEAASTIEESLSLLRSVGDVRSAAVTIAVRAGMWRDAGDLDGALTSYGESLRVLDDLGDPVGVGMALDGIVTVLERRGRPGDAELAARLRGASSRLPIGPGERGRAEEDAVGRASASLRAVLGDAAYEAAFAAGRAADRSTIVAEALACAISSTSSTPPTTGGDRRGTGS